MEILPLLVLVLSWWTEAARTQMHLTPASLTVVVGDEARFRCSTSNTAWTLMTWLLGNRPVLTIDKQNGVLPTINANITAAKCSKPKAECWEFILRHTERSHQGQVACDLQLIDRRTAELLVQEKGNVKVFGENRLAFKGELVLFQCQAAGWYPEPTLQWQVHDKKVSRDEYNISTEEKENLFTVSSNLSIQAGRSSVVGCLASVSALRKPLESSVSLTVVAEVLEEEEDCTVLVAVTATLAALLLLVLLSICTVLCYRRSRKAKKTPQDVLRSHQSGFWGSSVAEATGGNVNPGFSSESTTDVDSSEIIVGTRSQMNFDTFRKVPDVVHSSSFSLHTEGRNTEFQEDNAVSNVRRITTV
ncbi:immunoglobulin superfamily member 5 isoform X1 [Poecilia reticulata]|uniref:immunoglobulin superfamily member 5 isoform X1 n=1 Tax=Poecilia reticulata TaxID=8081 RepID=UPI0004A4B454|nr:PREDICTED: immunoglobulin superfamily member 5-like isoform X1 [Poecilia reticulata]